jgi:hypothetical protein
MSMVLRATVHLALQLPVDAVAEAKMTDPAAVVGVAVDSAAVTSMAFWIGPLNTIPIKTANCRVMNCG